MKIGFAITAYDKFEEAKILIEIIRKEFKGDYKIAFCSNHPDGKKFSDENQIDLYTQGRDIKYYGGDRHSPSLMRDRISIVLRSTDTVQTSCLSSLKLDVDYIIHMHSDAWTLSEERLLELVGQMKFLNKKIAIRGEGLEAGNAGRAIAMDDHFFVFEKEFCMKHRVFEFLPEYFFPERYDVHEILFMNILAKAGLNHIWYYRNTRQLYNYDGKKLLMRTVRPVSYDTYYCFLHVHRESFPESYGKSIQALYLKKCGFTNSEFITKFINQFYVEETVLISTLTDMEQLINKKLKFWGFDNSIIQNREIIFKNNLLTHCSLKSFVTNHMQKLLKKLWNQYSNRKRNIPYQQTEYDSFYKDSVAGENSCINKQALEDLYYHIGIF